MRRRACSVLIALWASGTGTAYAQTPLFVGITDHLTGYADVIAWGSCSDIERTKHCRLRYMRDGTVRFAPIREQSRYHWFDVDAGRDVSGRLTFIYSRCGGHGTSEEVPNARKGCRLYTYRPGDRYEHRLQVPIPKGQSAYKPAIDGNRTVYFTSRSTDNPRRSDRPVMNVWDGKHLHRAHIGSYAPGQVDANEPAMGPVRVDAADGAIVVVWKYQAPETLCHPSGLDNEYEATEVWLVDSAGRRRRLITTAGCAAYQRSDVIRADAATITGDHTIVAAGGTDGDGWQVARFAPDGTSITQHRMPKQGPYTGLGATSGSIFVFGTYGIDDPLGIYEAD
jgi:hypothetical protein